MIPPDFHHTGWVVGAACFTALWCCGLVDNHVCERSRGRLTYELVRLLKLRQQRGENELVVGVHDPTDLKEPILGKQGLIPRDVVHVFHGHLVDGLAWDGAWCV